MTTFISFLEYIPFWLFIRIMKFFNFNTRIFISAKVIGFIIRNTPKYKKRVLKNLNLIYPKMSDLEKNNFLKKFSQNLGLTFSNSSLMKNIINIKILNFKVTQKYQKF